MALTQGNAASNSGTGVSSLDVSLTLGSSDRRRVFVFVHLSSVTTGTLTVSSVQIDPTGTPDSGTQEVTFAEVYAGGGRIERAAWWEVSTSKTGSQTIRVTASASCDIDVVAVEYSDAGTTGDTNGTNGNLGSYSYSVTSAASSDVILTGWGGVASRSADGTSWAGSGTELLEADWGTTTYLYGTHYQSGTGGADTVSNTLNASARSAVCSIAVPEDTGGGGGGSLPPRGPGFFTPRFYTARRAA